MIGSFDKLRARCAVVGLLVALAGCSQTPPRVSVPQYAPDAIAEGMLTEFDADKNGALAGAELASLRMLTRSDTNGDKALDRDELAAIAQKWVDENVGRCELNCQVTKGGRPVANAQVTYRPLDCLSDVLPTAEGTTDSAGHAPLATPGADGTASESGLPPGFYRVEVVPAGAATPVVYSQIYEVSSLDTNAHRIAL